MNEVQSDPLELAVFSPEVFQLKFEMVKDVVSFLDLGTILLDKCFHLTFSDEHMTCTFNAELTALPGNLSRERSASFTLEGVGYTIGDREPLDCHGTFSPGSCFLVCLMCSQYRGQLSELARCNEPLNELLHGGEC